MDNIPLLKSIDYKDPSLNWNIDVSAELEKYLSAIELLDEDVNYNQNIDVGNYNQQSSSAQGNYCQLFNFVEAALIIQNSTSLYSKKIEHLHSLVYETFNLLSTGRSSEGDTVKGVYNDDSILLTNVNGNKTNNLDKNVFLLSVSDILSVPIELLQPGKSINIQYDQCNKNKLMNNNTSKYSSYSSYIGISNIGNNISLPQYRINQNTNVLFLDETDLEYFSSENQNTDANLLVNKSFDGDDASDDLVQNLFEEKNNNDLNDHADYNADNTYSDDINVDNGLLLCVDNDDNQNENENENYINYEDVQVVDGDKSTVRKSDNTMRKRIPKEDFWLHLDEHSKVGKDKPLKVSKTCKNPSKVYTTTLGSINSKHNLINFIDDKNIVSYILGEHYIDGFKYENNAIPHYSDLKLPKLNVERLFTSFDSAENNYLRSLEGEFTLCTNSWRKYHSKNYFSQYENKNNSMSEFVEYTTNDVDDGFDAHSNPEPNNFLVLESMDDIEQEDAIQQPLEENHANYTIENDMTELLEYDMSELHEKINVWSEHVEPLLQAQRNRPEFNIYEESEKILTNINEKKGVDDSIHFYKLTQGLKKWEICRSFLATLMLANNEEIEIVNCDDSAFSIKLANNTNEDYAQLSNSNKVTKLNYPKKKKSKNDDTVHLRSRKRDKL